jgi:POT family proton-dependent oligopeptide transporter
MGGYRYGFMLAGAGMILGVVCFGLGGSLLQGKGLAPAGKEGVKPLLMVVAGCAAVVPVIYLLLSLSEDVVGYILYATFGAIIIFLTSVALKETAVVKQRMFVLVLLLILNAVFWMGFEQAGNALNFFAKKQLHPFTMGGWSMPAEWWQSVNAVLIVILGPVFAGLWVALDRRSANPSIPAKFGMGLIGMGLGFSVLILGINGADAAGKVMWSYLLGLYFVHTMGELCLSPVGLSMVTKLAPERMTGMVMGSWFISIATGNFLAGKVSSLIAARAKDVGTALEKVQAYGGGFTYVLYLGVGVGVTLLLCSKLINRWMHGIK